MINNVSSEMLKMNYCVTTMAGKYFAVMAEFPPGSSNTILFQGTPSQVSVDGSLAPLRDVMVVGNFVMEHLYGEEFRVSIGKIKEKKNDK